MCFQEMARQMIRSNMDHQMAKPLAAWGVLFMIILEADRLPDVKSFIPWCREQAPAYLGFVPATKKQRQKDPRMSLCCCLQKRLLYIFLLSRLSQLKLNEL